MEIEETNTDYIEETLKALIKNALFHLNNVNGIIEEMGNDPKVIKMWIESAEKISGILDKLIKLEKMKSSNQKDTSKHSIGNGNSPKNVTNNLYLGSTSELLTKIETSMGLTSIEDIKKEV